MGLANVLVSKIHIFFLIYLGAMLYFDFTDHTTKIEDLEVEQTTIQNRVQILERQIKKAEAFQKNLETSQAKVEEVEKQITDVQRQLPNEIRDTEILDFLSVQAEDINLKDLFLTPLDESLRDFYYAKKFEVKAVGTYLQTLIFFERLSFSDRLFNIAELDLKTATNSKQGRFQLLDMKIKLETFRYNPNYKVEVKPKIDPTKKGPQGKRKRRKR